MLRKKLLHDVMPTTPIFPVSGQHAYLAQRTRLTMKHGNGNGKDSGLGWQDGWVDAFSCTALSSSERSGVIKKIKKGIGA
ncbi:hypothetical protein PQR62_12255 [Herbaspirillum lusitanum]|uniref:Uncharacterized protein n=1 Tax=Herbaspirillum lusitanum TaxID=213312 RepID=A0ABW9A858_9BURK